MTDLFALDAERELLASLAFRGQEAWLRVAPLGLTAAAFSAPHRGAWRVLVHLAERGIPATGITFREAALTLGETHLADETTDCLGSLMEFLGTLENAPVYGRIVADLAERRRVLESAEKLAAAARDRACNLTEAVRQQFGAMTSPRGVTTLTADAFGEAMRDLATESKLGGMVPGVSVGLYDLDQTLDGFVAGRLIVLAARPGCGKTAFATFAAHQVADGGDPVLFVTLEQPIKQLQRRRIALTLGVDLRAEIRSGRWPALLPQIEAVRPALENVPLVFDDAAHTVSEIALAVHRMRAQEQRPKLVIVDHLSWVRSDAPASTSHHIAVGKITKGLAGLAKAEDCAVLLLVQLNRESVKGGTKPRRPTLADLRDSGEIEQDADQVVMLWEPEPDDVPGRTAEVEFNIPKNRHGPLATHRAHWDKACNKYQKAYRYAALEAA